MGIFDSTEEHPPSKIRRYIITAIAAVVLLTGILWYMLRFHAEKVTVHHFMDAVVAGDMQTGYKIWKPSPSYSFKDFVDDWGPNGYYGPVKSYRIEDAEHLRNGSAAVVIVEISPDQPYPEENDAAKQNKVKEIKLWVDLGNQSISFPPF